MSITLTDLCDVMNNWFDENTNDGTRNRYFGTFTIENGQIDLSDIGIQENQYYRIVGSVFNDGVYQYHAPVESEEQEESEEPEESDEQVTEPSGENQNENDEESNTNSEDENSETEEPELTDETFEGAIWAMAVPKKVIALLEEINTWNDKYGPIVDSPFNSETFGGYSYYKGYKNTMSNVSGWSSKFAEKINKWRKVRNI